MIYVNRKSSSSVSTHPAAANPYRQGLELWRDLLRLRQDVGCIIDAEGLKLQANAIIEDQVFREGDEGGETGRPRSLPALQADAQPLRFLDFLIHEPEPAVILHGAGILVQVPAPARYAVHKLIVSRRRREGPARRDKDVQQAGVLLGVLAGKRPHELRLAWEEAYGRGPTWRKLLLQGLSAVTGSARDLTLRTLGISRSRIPDLDLTFANPAVRYDFSRDVAIFEGRAPGSSVACMISREALDDHFGTNGLGQKERVESVLRNRSGIEAMTRAKYLSWPVEEPEMVLIRTMDVPALLKEVSGAILPALGPRTTRNTRTKR
jgi:hypothetical protein